MRGVNWQTLPCSDAIMKTPDPADYGLSRDALTQIERSIDLFAGRLTSGGAILGYSGAVIGFWDTLGFLGLFFSIGPAFVGGLVGAGLASIINKLRFPSYYRFKDAYGKYETWFVRTQMDFWSQLSGVAFEHEVAALLTRLGHRVRLTPVTGDRGVDIFVDDGTIIQCKAHKTPVGPAVARELYGTLKDHNVRRAVLVSKAGFTSGVHEFVKGKPISLWDIHALIAMQKQCDTQTKV